MPAYESLDCNCGISTAAIAAIVVGVVAVLAIGGGLAVYFVVKAKKAVPKAVGSVSIAANA